MANPIELKLNEIEAEMKRIGFWTENPPELMADYNRWKRKTYLDAPSFELWLQCIFIPRAREAVRTNRFPKNSQVGGMAMRQYDYHSYVEEALPLVALLNEFDDMVISRAG